MEDYSTLPCNDAEEVDKHVYETPLDEEGYAEIFSEPEQYGNSESNEVHLYQNCVHYIVKCCLPTAWLHFVSYEERNILTGCMAVDCMSTMSGTETIYAYANIERDSILCTNSSLRAAVITYVITCKIAFKNSHSNHVVYSIVSTGILYCTI